MKGLVSFAGIQKKKKAQGHPDQLEAMKLSLWYWIFCRLVYPLDLVVGIDST